MVRDENNFGKGGSSEEGKQWSETICMSDVELTELLDGWKMGCEQKRGITDDSWVFGLSGWWWHLPRGRRFGDSKLGEKNEN